MANVPPAGDNGEPANAEANTPSAEEVKAQQAEHYKQAEERSKLFREVKDKIAQHHGPEAAQKFQDEYQDIEDVDAAKKFAEEYKQAYAAYEKLKDAFGTPYADRMLNEWKDAKKNSSPPPESPPVSEPPPAASNDQGNEASNPLTY